MKYRKRPVEVEAFCFSADADTIAPKWFTQAIVDERIWIDRSIVDGHARIYGCTIYTLEGRMRARPGDYIIKGVNGELYPCKPDIFRKTYDPVT